MKDKSIKDISDLVGEELTDRMLDVFGKEESVVHWFYSPCFGLGNVSPHDWYIHNGPEEMEKIIGRIEHGVYS